MRAVSGRPLALPPRPKGKHDGGRCAGVPLDVVDEGRLRNCIGRDDERKMRVDDVDVKRVVLAPDGLDTREIVFGEGRVIHDGKSRGASVFMCEGGVPILQQDRDTTWQMRSTRRHATISVDYVEKPRARIHRATTIRERSRWQGAELRQPLCSQEARSDGSQQAKAQEN